MSLSPVGTPPRRDAPRLAIPVTEAEEAVLAALRELHYGSVEVVVHSDRIVQITRSQKLRVDGRRRYDAPPDDRT